MKQNFDHDFGILVRSKLIELGLESVHDNSKYFNYTHLERKAVIEKALKEIYNIVGVKETPLVKDLAESIYSNYKGLSYRYFPKLNMPYDLVGSINSIGDSCISKVLIVDESDWQRRREVYIQPIKCKSYGRSVSNENLKMLLEFFTYRPVSNLETLKRQIEETMKMLYTPENKFEINLHVFYGDYVDLY